MSIVPAGASFVLTREQSRRLDQLAVEEFGIPSIILMENAARALAEQAQRMMQERGIRRVMVAAGPGNNGGDGFAAARMLHNMGAEVVVRLAADESRVRSDAKVNLKIAKAMGLSVLAFDPDSTCGSDELDGHSRDEPTLVIDALLGTGLTQPPRAPISRLIELINGWRERGCPVLAADLPSGLDCDSGETPGDVVGADATVTFAAYKPALAPGSAAPCCGSVSVGDIGAPRELLERLGRRI